jgi:hypothetical protein
MPNFLVEWRRINGQNALKLKVMMNSNVRRIYSRTYLAGKSVAFGIGFLCCFHTLARCRHPVRMEHGKHGDCQTVAQDERNNQTIM